MGEVVSIPNSTAPTMKDLAADRRAYRAVEWVMDRMKERSRLTPAQRAERAAFYDERAENAAIVAASYPPHLEFAGLQRLAANLMRAPS